MINDKTSAASIRWMLNLWPPFLFQGIRVLDIENDFLSARIRVRRSILTRNLMGTTFGGALASAADPFYPILYWRWLKSASHNLAKLPCLLAVFLNKRSSQLLTSGKNAIK